MPLGELLITNDVITKEQLDEALKHKQTSKTNKYLGEILVELGHTTELQIKKALEFQYRIPLVDITEINIDKEAVACINEQLARKYSLIPIMREGNILTVTMADPLDYYALDDIKRVTSYEIRQVMSIKDDIINAIDRFYGGESAERAVEALQAEYAELSADELAQLSEGEVSNAPIVKLINSIISHAVKTGASDIHIEPMDKDIRVRFRVDGALQEVMRSPKTAHGPLTTRIKIMSALDIAEKRIPQDGRIETIIDGRSVDLRISILPTVYGEKTVIRVLGLGKNVTYSRDKIGFTEQNNKLFESIIKSPNGIILVSGPTGSGKSTTLYTVLTELNSIDTNIITVEDPVEYKLAGINQVQVNAKAGLTFANGLRSILRQDPDIIMIGEIRDGETAEIAMRAAITGHLVLSTIHTNDAPSSISRLVDMGIQPYLVSTSVVGIIAQRLVRKICTRCKKEYMPDHGEMMMLKLKEPRPLYKGAGCPACNHTGYSGRTAIHEVLPISKEIKDLIEKRATVEQIRQIATRLGTISLRESAALLVFNGTTTTSELLKVTYSLD
ncbi:MAG: Flp pilus assembly complex ATPase component TadA [Clostridiales bacterium]|jgi:type IV pilus assembly protein PilB|nr:Flp pilus assembly complex ATPase component TadA [Clostridiales bacterium]